MRILLITHHYDPETRPPQLRWSALVRDLVAAGHEVHVIAPAPHYPLGRLLPGEDPDQVGHSHPGLHGETIHRVGFRPTDGSAISTLLDQVVVGANTVVTAWRRRHQIAPDVVIATVPALPTAFVGGIVSLLLRRPVVLEMRDAWPDLFSAVPDLLDRAPRAHHSPVRGWIRRLGLGLAHRVMSLLQHSADLVVTTTDSYTDVLRSRGVRSVLTIRNAHHELGATVDPGAAPAQTTARELTTPPQLRIVYAGTIGRAQGLETAVRALALTREAGVDATLRVVGGGAGLDAVRELTGDLGVPVTFVPQVPRSQVADHYAWADTVLVMLRACPGLEWTVPSKLYEALALGLHVSGSVAGEAAGIIAATDAGFAVPPEDPAALAQAWVDLARQPHRPDSLSTRRWLHENASEELASARYLHALTTLVQDGARVA